MSPTIIIDTREQTPLGFTKLPSETGCLQSGDYSVRGCEELFAIERKSIADLVGCCTGDNRQRFEREMHRLRGFQFKRLLIIGDRSDIEQHRYRSNIPPASILGSLAAWEIRYDLPVVWTPDPIEGAILIETWSHYFAREIAKQAESLSKITIQN
jgi:DNA excision repair protein ERCC-4